MPRMMMMHAIHTPECINTGVLIIAHTCALVGLRLQAPTTMFPAVQKALIIILRTQAEKNIIATATANNETVITIGMIAPFLFVVYFFGSSACSLCSWRCCVAPGH